ncbi:hypothetical protein ACLIUU_000237 [Citrobacter werkmanii]|uniref:hypothetical protein n=1 Tax=Citrobacter freundii complex TaxID=1344959 RepID=UPI0015754961|nr:MULTISPECIES: hypothetical protein [Citrobacter]NTY82390.1 hypothetical protein [Citrobacter werkmanii]
MRFVIGLFLFFTSFYVSAMCYSGDFSIGSSGSNNLTATGEAIKVDLNKAKLNEFTPSTLKYVNFLSSQKYHCQYANSGLQVTPLENNNITYFRVSSGESNDFVYVAVRIGNNFEGAFNKEEKSTLFGTIHYFNFTGSDINDVLQYGVEYMLVPMAQVNKEVIINNSASLNSPLYFVEANGSDRDKHNLSQIVQVEFNYTPTTCYFPDTSVKVNPINYRSISNAGAESANNNIEIKCDDVLAYSSRRIYYRFESQNHDGDVLKNEYLGDDSAGDIGFKLELNGVGVSLDNNRYEIVQGRGAIAKSYTIPLKFKYFPYGEYHSGHILSRVKVVIGYD